MSPVVVILVTVVPVRDEPTVTFSPFAASAPIGRPSALATSAAAPPSEAARIARRERWAVVSTVMDGPPSSEGRPATEGSPGQSIVAERSDEAQAVPVRGRTAGSAEDVPGDLDVGRARGRQR